MEPVGIDSKYVAVNPALRRYLQLCSEPADQAVLRLGRATAELGDAAGMMIPAEQAVFLQLLAKLVDATTVVDIGTFTGMSALAFAQAIGPEGRVVTCDNSERWIGIARRFWAEAGVAERIDFRLGPAAATLRDWPPDRPVDLVFIDADKLSYRTYVALAVPLLRAGGLLVLDNVLLDGYVVDPSLAGGGLLGSAATRMRELNASVAGDPRLEAVMLPIADGMTIARKR